MKALLYFIIIISIFMTNCNETIENKKNNDYLIKTFFSNDEFEDLELIILFFENQLKKSYNGDLTICYKKYLKNINQHYKNEDFKFNKEDQQALFKKISKSTFYNIWYIGKSISSQDGDTSDILLINLEGKYVKFVKEYSKNKKYISEYFIGASDSDCFINCVSEIYIMHNYNEFDLNDKMDRLILAVHFITLNSRFLKNAIIDL